MELRLVDDDLCLICGPIPPFLKGVFVGSRAYPNSIASRAPQSAPKQRGFVVWGRHRVCRFWRALLSSRVPKQLFEKIKFT
jgi:hypothetical protein